MLPDSSESTVLPTNVMISACSPRPIMPSSITPAISWPKRTQRVQWMQRVISSVEISGPRFLWNTTRFFFVVARADAAVADREVLQLALAALVADRAVERMVDQQELHHALLRLDRLLASASTTFMPSVTGVAQAGSGLGAFSTCTRHMRQLAAIDSFL